MSFLISCNLSRFIRITCLIIGPLFSTVKTLKVPLEVGLRGFCSSSELLFITPFVSKLKNGENLFGKVYLTVKSSTLSVATPVNSEDLKAVYIRSSDVMDVPSAQV